VYRYPGHEHDVECILCVIHVCTYTHTTVSDGPHGIAVRTWTMRLWWYTEWMGYWWAGEMLTEWKVREVLLF